MKIRSHVVETFGDALGAPKRRRDFGIAQQITAPVQAAVSVDFERAAKQEQDTREELPVAEERLKLAMEAEGQVYVKPGSRGPYGNLRSNLGGRPPKRCQKGTGR